MSKLSQDFPKFSDVLSIQSNPEDLFELLYPIGIGGFGKVYKAIHKATLKIFAIKIIDYTKDGINNKKNISFNYNSVQEETALMRLLQNNENILNYYGSYYSRKTNMIWLILEYCSCGSLKDLMYSIDRVFSEIEIATFMEMVLKGLIYLHDLNIIHRDIKGQNLLVTEDGCVKLSDFGVGIKLTEKEYRHSKKGSPYWMSPQVVLQNDYDIKTDIWSLGITCMELTQDEEDFPLFKLKPKAVMNKIAKGEVKVEDIINVEEYSESFVDFVGKCIVVDPTKRATARELIEHEFIKKNSQGKEYIEDLIKQYQDEIKQYMNEKSNNIKNLEKNKEINNNTNNNNQILDKEEINNNIEKEDNEEEEEKKSEKKENSNEQLYSYINENDNNKENESEQNNTFIINDDNNDNDKNNNEQDQNDSSVIVKDDKQNEQISSIIKEAKNYIDDIDIGDNENDDEVEDYNKKKLEEMIKDIQEKIEKKKKIGEEENAKQKLEEKKRNKDKNILKTPTKKEKNEFQHSMNINLNLNDQVNIDMKKLLLDENEKLKNKNIINYNPQTKRSEVKTGITGSKIDSSDGKKFSNNLLKLESKFFDNENINNNIYTKKKINFIDHDLSNIDDESEDEKINPVKQSFKFNDEENNKFDKYFTEKKILKTAVKQHRINFLDKVQINRYLNEFDISTKDDKVVQNIHFSACKKHKKYFN